MASLSLLRHLGSILFIRLLQQKAHLFFPELHLWVQEHENTLVPNPCPLKTELILIVCSHIFSTFAAAKYH